MWVAVSAQSAEVWGCSVPVLQPPLSHCALRTCHATWTRGDTFCELFKTQALLGGGEALWPAGPFYFWRPIWLLKEIR